LLRFVPEGLANPGPIIAELWTDEELEAAVTLDGVVTLVDGRNILRQLREPRLAGQPNEAQLQVALADVILLNKVGDWGMRLVGACVGLVGVDIYVSGATRGKNTGGVGSAVCSVLCCW
jgi:hypothetical protein